MDGRDKISIQPGVSFVMMISSVDYLKHIKTDCTTLVEGNGDNWSVPLSPGRTDTSIELRGADLHLSQNGGIA